MKYIVLLSLLFFSCASVQPISGGEKDTNPPEVVSSTIDSAALFVNKNTVTFTFDEYIKAKNTQENLLISPNQIKPPTITVKNKKLTITLNDSLKENTTYTYQFNETILDNNEGNPITDYKFIYSTGNYIDSAFYAGKVKNYITKEPCDGCKILLYTKYRDSSVVLDKPAYISTTNENGTFNFTNLPNDTFYAVALQDGNKNSKLNTDEYVSLPRKINTETSRIDTFNIFLNKNSDPLRITQVAKTPPGVFKYNSNQPLLSDSIKLIINNKPVLFSINPSKDTITTIYKQLVDSLDMLILVHMDTFTFDHTKDLSSIEYTIKPKITTYQNYIELTSKTPIENIDSAKLTLLIDSVYQSIKLYRIDTFSFKINYNSSSHLKLSILKGALTDINKQVNKTDTLSIAPYKDLETNLKLTIVADSNTSYILTLLQGDKPYYTQYFTGLNDLTLNNIKPGTYKVRIETDSNNNGIWDTGDIYTNKPPEPIFLSEPFDIRQNWDKELTVNIK